MEASPGKKERTHDRIVEVAARALRRNGFAGVGVAEVMREAGLTHGGFYAHFPSRDAMLREALERAGHDSAGRMAEVLAARPPRGASAFKTYVEHYLSAGHVHGPGGGCPVAALAGELPRQSPMLCAVGADRVREVMSAVRGVLPGRAERGAAPVIAAQLVGAVQLARTLGNGPEGNAVLAAVRRHLLEQFDARGNQ
ncbi:MAG TPA: TetR/AcrR family transcriptional regulator [Burkholderiaceae bacterium]|nr:TetR/AcrR family transcriptional regulator [Burkholderiaceae bacterium]